jgi:hypothetical protein
MVEESRFATISTKGAKWVLGLLLALILASLWPAAQQPKSPVQPVSTAKSEQKTAKSGEAEADLALYKAIVGRMQAGENYYAVAADEQRKRGYPLKPFVTVRQPTLALVLASLGRTWGHVLELAIGLTVLFVWYRKLIDQKVIAWRRSDGEKLWTYEKLRLRSLTGHDLNRIKVFRVRTNRPFKLIKLLHTSLLRRD